MERTLTIRFSHIDGASIVFYPRYFEMLSELFVDLPFAQAPFGMRTDFLRPNFLGDEIRVVFEDSRLKPLPQKAVPPDGRWSFTACMGDERHFSVASLPSEESELDPSAHRPDLPAFQSDAISLAPWTSDCTGCLQVSRFFELVNVAVEQWFPRTLGLTFHELHIVNSGGIPTVTMRTRCRELPRAGDSVTMWIRPTEIGKKSLTFTSWLVRHNECLLENEQTIVFVKVNGTDFKSIPIPDEIRQRLLEQYVAA